MATRTVDDCSKEGKRDDDAAARLKASLLELEASVAGGVAALLAACAEGVDGASAATLDQQVREAVLEASRRGLEQGLEADRSDCGAANAPRCGECGGPTRCLGRERSPTETGVGTIRLAMGRHAPECAGPSPAPTPSFGCAAPGSAAGSTTIGTTACAGRRDAPPTPLPKNCRTPPHRRDPACPHRIGYTSSP